MGQLSSGRIFCGLTELDKKRIAFFEHFGLIFSGF
jgi:hypothetical protein